MSPTWSTASSRGPTAIEVLAFRPVAVDQSASALRRSAALSRLGAIPDTVTVVSLTATDHSCNPSSAGNTVARLAAQRSSGTPCARVSAVSGGVVPVAAAKAWRKACAASGPGALPDSAAPAGPNSAVIR